MQEIRSKVVPGSDSGLREWRGVWRGAEGKINSSLSICSLSFFFLSVER